MSLWAVLDGGLDEGLDLGLGRAAEWAEAGVLALESDVLTIETENKPGVLATIAERLAKAEVNIEYAYLAAGPKAAKGLIILRLSDVEKAQSALRDL